MAHLDVSYLEIHPSCPVTRLVSASPDDISMFELFDEDADASLDVDIKREPIGFRSFTADSSATILALEVLKSLDNDFDDDAGNPESSSSRVHDSGSSYGSLDERPLPSKTKMSAEEKKRRNRDCMRRLRNRRNDLIASMRIEIQTLETQLNTQLEISNGSGPISSAPDRTELRYQRFKRLQLDNARVKAAMRQLREENYWLQKQLVKRQEAHDTVEQLVAARQQVCPPIDLDLMEEEDIGLWIRNTDHFVPPLDHRQAREVVMDSFRLIQEGIRATEKMKAVPNTVLGWSDRRSVDAHWASFMMQKTFPHENARELALKTWRMTSNVQDISMLQPKAHEMKILQRLNEFTVVIARNTYFDDVKFSYCMIYLLFLLETETGFVVGSRSIEPDHARMKAFTSESMVVAKPFHCFHFQNDEASGGCKLTFAGQVDNVIDGCATTCAMDMLLAMMRWESHCVSPLWRLAN